MEDVVRKLGLLTLGSRFRRIGERLQADTQQIMEQLGVPLMASQFPYLAALDRLGPVGIGELSQALGVAQPGVTRSISQLEAIGWVKAVSPSGDQRRKIVTLTDEGRKLVENAKTEVWPKIEAAVADLCGKDGAELLLLLDAIEDGLAARPLTQRADLSEARS